MAAKRRRQSTRLENLGIPEEELLRQQQELFARARAEQEAQQRQVQKLGLAFFASCWVVCQVRFSFESSVTLLRCHCHAHSDLFTAALAEMGTSARLNN